MRQYIMSFCGEFDYPAEAAAALSGAYDIINGNSGASEIFRNHTGLYNSNQLTDHGSSLEAMDKISLLSGVHRYTVHLLFYICLSAHTRELYVQKNIPYSVFYDSMSDLKWKLLECHKIYGVWGSFVAWWFNRFFDLTRFALGRLQFETYEFDRDYSKDGYSLQAGDTVLNVHIPSSGPLRQEDCQKSYQLAAEFYKDIFIGRPAVFRCESWLLDPQHREFLPETSNILKFMSDYDIISSSIDETGGFLWRIFGTMETGDISALPRDTALRRAYADWLEKGNKCGCGLGVFFFK